MFLRPLEYHQNRFHPRQETAWLAYKAGKGLVFPWGRRSGKTDLIAELFIEDIEENGKDCVYCALVQSQAIDIFWPKLDERLSTNPHWKPNRARHEYTHLPSGAVISLKGFDMHENRLRGNAKRLIALDEYAFCKDPGIVRRIFIPMLADYNGKMIYTSSPNGKNHFYQLVQRAKKDNAYFTTSCTMFDNPFISEKGRQELLAEYAGTDDPLYRQEILGEFVVLEGMAFALPQDSYVEKRWDNADLTNSFHWRGVDHGYSPDPTACLWLAYNQKKAHWLIYQEYKKARLLIADHSKIINGLESFHYVNTYSDIDPQLIAEYAAVGLNMAPAQKHDKNARILRLVTALKTGKLKIAANCTELLAEMQNYYWEQDGNDHLIDSLNYVYNNAVIPVEPPKEEIKDYRLRDRWEGANWEGQDFGD